MTDARMNMKAKQVQIIWGEIRLQDRFRTDNHGPTPLKNILLLSKPQDDVSLTWAADEEDGPRPERDWAKAPHALIKKSRKTIVLNPRDSTTSHHQSFTSKKQPLTPMVEQRVLTKTTARTENGHHRGHKTRPRTTDKSPIQHFFLLYTVSAKAS